MMLTRLLFACSRTTLFAHVLYFFRTLKLQTSHTVHTETSLFKIILSSREFLRVKIILSSNLHANYTTPRRFSAHEKSPNFLYTLLARIQWYFYFQYFPQKLTKR
jgi:hypothetical protein